MKSPLHILHLEEDPNDAELVQSVLETGGIVCVITCVQTRADFVQALERGDIDLILSEFALPAFDGLSAAEIVRKRWSAMPFILVSGSLGEQLAIDSFKSGATDCIPKRELSRLVPAVLRAMWEVEEWAERRLLEAQVIEAQKMEVISQLSSGVAHDFNNILAVIVGYSELITLNLSSDSPVRKYAEEIRHASNRAAGLTRQLLVFSRKQLVQLHVIDPNDAVKDLEILLSRLIDNNIEIAIVYGQGGHVRADPGHIGQVLMNLALNARDAMPNGGKLSIETENVTLDENYMRTHRGTTSGVYVMLSVSDTGTGMTEKVKARLFEPFFTTKPLGTGLGLATCRTIVEQSGGYIDVFSEKGKGTTFKIYFPRVEQPLDVAAEPIHTPPLHGTRDLHLAETGPLIPSQSAHRILVVDDDKSIRELTTEMLTRSGFEVDVAADGAAGWEALQVNRYDLLITDNFMPKVTGIEMVQKLHANGMQLPVIMATALFPQEQFISHPWLETIPTLIKPFESDELLSTVIKVLSASDGNREQIAPRN
jgi:two-component system, cell cycle sensor histidine kinase and response regulator CckA